MAARLLLLRAAGPCSCRTRRCGGASSRSAVRKIGQAALRAALRTAGATVIEITSGTKPRLLGHIDAILFPSSGSVAVIAEHFAPEDALLERAFFAAMGPDSAAAAGAAGFPPQVVAGEPDIGIFVAISNAEFIGAGSMTISAPAIMHLSERPRRLRRTEVLRDFVREHEVSLDMLVQPLFIDETITGPRRHFKHARDRPFSTRRSGPGSARIICARCQARVALRHSAERRTMRAVPCSKPKALFSVPFAP